MLQPRGLITETSLGWDGVTICLSDWAQPRRIRRTISADGSYLDEPASPNDIDSSSPYLKYASQKPEPSNSDPNYRYKNKVPYFKTSDGKSREDLYAVLNLGHLRWLATPQQIKKAYYEAARTLHPDKFQSSDESYFKAVNLAWNILSDPIKRKSYDSIEPFDESIPDSLENVTDDEFYELMAPIFTRNAKWSRKASVPGLGKPDTPIDDVVKFYSFWESFGSWRTFDLLNTHDLETAENRAVRRWMQRENQQAQAEKLRTEAIRIGRLVAISKERDPRLKSMREASLTMKRKSKSRRELGDNQTRTQQNGETSNGIKILDPTTQNEAISNIRDIPRSPELKALLKQLEYMANNQPLLQTRYKEGLQYILENCIDISIIKSLLLEFNRKAIDNVCSMIERIEGSIRRSQKAKEATANMKYSYSEGICSHSKVPERIAATDDKWSVAEIRRLRRAMAIFAPGIPNRWKCIAEYLNKTEQQIIVRVELEFSNMQLESSPNTIDERSSKGKSQHSQKVHTSNTLSSTGHVQNQATMSTESSSDAWDESTGLPVNRQRRLTILSWTKEEQKRLEDGLRKYSAAETNRWDSIASYVATKSNQQCLDRFKYVVHVIKNKK